MEKWKSHYFKHELWDFLHFLLEKNMNFILTPEQQSYADLKTPGKIVIEQDDSGRIVCLVSGFEFESELSGRIIAAKAIAWGLDVLDAAIRADAIVPGGQIISVIDYTPRRNRRGRAK